jgi:DNA-binding NarL/FixJ family response regulator
MTQVTDALGVSQCVAVLAVVSMKRITVLLADDNGLVRRGFRKILDLQDDFDVVGEAKNGRLAVAMVKRLRPAMVLMDIAMPLLNGLQATREILRSAPATKVIMLSAHSDEAYIEEANNSGAMGYLIKLTASETVCLAIRDVEQGKTYYSASIPKRLHKRQRKSQTV